MYEQFFQFAKNGIKHRLVQILPRVNINARDFAGRTALILAIVGKNYEIVKLLIEHGADVNIIPSSGTNTLHLAVYHNAPMDILQMLMDAGVDKNKKDKDGLTALHIAVKKNFSHIIEFLIESGVDMNAKSKLGLTPLHYALYDDSSSIHCLKELLEHGASINEPNSNGDTPLHFSINNHCSIDKIKLLLDYGADVDKKNKNNQSVINILIQENKSELEIFKILYKQSKKFIFMDVFDKIYLETMKSMKKIKLPYDFEIMYHGKPMKQQDLLRNPKPMFALFPKIKPVVYRSKEEYIDSNGILWVKIPIGPYHILTEKDKLEIVKLIAHFRHMVKYTVSIIETNKKINEMKVQQKISKQWNSLEKWLIEKKEFNVDKFVQFYETYYEMVQVLKTCLKIKRSEATTQSTFRHPIEIQQETRHTCEGYLMYAIYNKHIIMSMTVWKRNSNVDLQEHALIVGNIEQQIKSPTTIRNLSMVMHSFAANMVNSDKICCSPYEKMGEILKASCLKHKIPIVQDSGIVRQTDLQDYCRAYGCYYLIDNNENMKNIWEKRVIEQQISEPFKYF